MNREVLAIRHVHFEDLGSLELVLGERGRPVRSEEHTSELQSPC